MSIFLSKYFKTIRPQSWRAFLVKLVVAAYLLAALAAVTAVPFLAHGWLSTPFLGVFVEHDMIFNGDASFSTQPFQVTLPGYRLLKVDDASIPDVTSLQTALSKHAPGDQVTLALVAPDGATLTQSSTLIKFPAGDQWGFFYIPYIIGLIYLISAIWAFLTRRDEVIGQTFVIFGASIAVSTACLFDFETTQRLLPFWMIAISFAGGSFFALVLQFPQVDPILRRTPWLLWFAYTVAFLPAAYSLLNLYYPTSPASFNQGLQLQFLACGALTLSALVMLLVRRIHSTSPIDREQLMILLIGAIIGFLPIGIWQAISPFVPGLIFSPYLLVPMVVFALAIWYTIQRYWNIQASFFYSQILVYTTLIIFIALGYALIITGINLAFSGTLPPNSPLLTGIGIFIVALAFMPLRQWLERTINAIFFKGERTYQEQLNSFASDMTRAFDLASVNRSLRQKIKTALLPGEIHTFLHDPASDYFTAIPDETGHATSDLHFPAGGALTRLLSSRRKPLFIDDLDALPESLQPEKARLRLLGACVFAPLPARQGLDGWVALGPRPSGDAYSIGELNFLEALCTQAVLAFERALVVANMENRVHEMNILTHIAQEINLSSALDTILDSIYSQAAQAIPADDFRILLTSQKPDQLVPTFVVENGERLSPKNSSTTNTDFPLEIEVLRLKTTMLVSNYAQECQLRELPAPKAPLLAWIGVPLIAGNDAIGVLSLASRDPAITYTENQSKLITTIADLVAGAIVKARLLKETDRRARQMATLNDVSRQLTSTLEQESLLQGIVQSAVGLLACEAGSLFLLDETTDELVFRVATGPVADKLVNRRMPAKHGVAGRAVLTQAPVVVNDVHTFADWSPETDQYTGFVTKSLMALPFLINEKVIGVLEMVNKRDGSNFAEEDQELLSSFASQAAIAIENSRLYALTDRALNERLEELSVLQRIDRELNTSLDTERAVKITLDWAMRQSNSTAGLVGMVVEDNLQVMASENFSESLAAFANGVIPLEQFDLRNIVTSGQTTQSKLGGESKHLRGDARSRVLVPIRRESNTIGIIWLESSDPGLCSDETLNFLTRLSDHASIAIANAQLYSAVQAANEAKSDFVSLVAHELKNPMTSIKGYTELLTAKTVGSINEMQAGFLGTILSNVNQMNTLVTDLNDLSKIEAGRLRLDFSAIVLKDVIDDVRRTLQHQIEEKEQILAVEIPDGLPKLWADKSRLLQILVNLVSNAYKYTEKGGKITVAAECCANVWDPQGAPKVVHIWVQDNGIGIDQDEVDKVFQKFFRSENSQARDIPGTGLGLNITHSLVEMQGGRIWFESELYQGSTFHFTVPIAE
ncbi:MAG TPA: GAF domain-containing protein [Longilinea sp.]|nr:GAF domain-containing protein [Longilinea sp.]